MRVRKLTAVTAAVLALAGLSACRTNVGAAAVINGHRITESDVHSYLTPQGASSSAAVAFPTLVPKSIVLNSLVQERVFELTLTNTTGGLPTDAELRAQHDQAAATLAGQGVTGAQYDAQVAATLDGYGLTPKLLTSVLRDLDLEYALIVRINATTPADIAKAIAQQHISISVNPAYGAWSATDFRVLPPSGTTSSTSPCPAASPACPSGFLTLQSPTPSAAPTS